MWFLFGFVTLISFSIYFGYKRIYAGWKGESGSTDGADYQYKILTHKSGITGFLLSIKGPKDYDFLFKRESWYDRFFKAIGVSVENQLGNRAFDDLVYIISDDKRLHAKLSMDYSIVDAITRIFQAGEDNCCKIKTVRCYSGRLWIKVGVGKKFTRDQVPKLAKSVVPLLQKMTDGLAKAFPSHEKKWRDPFIIQAAVILAISTGLAINGAVHLMRLAWFTVPFTIDVNALIIDSLYWGAGIALILVFLALGLLGRTARAHLVLIELLSIGLFGAVATSFSQLHGINMDFDSSVASIHQTKTLDKTLNRGSKSTSYYLHVQDWNAKNYRKKVTVSGNFYRQVSIGDILRVTQKSGYLKYRWVESMGRYDR